MQGAPVATVLMLLIVGVTFAAWKWIPDGIGKLGFRPAAWVGPGVPRDGRWWTPVTSAFVHADMTHLLFNGITFFAFGFALERTMGSWRFAVLYALGVLAGSFGTWLTHRREPGYLTVGASGAILAVLFAFIVYQPESKMFVFPLPVPIPSPLFAVLYLAWSVFAQQRGGGRTNHAAHLGGAALGVGFVAVTDPGAFAGLLGWITGR